MWEGIRVSDVSSAPESVVGSSEEGLTIIPIALAIMSPILLVDEEVRAADAGGLTAPVLNGHGSVEVAAG